MRRGTIATLPNQEPGWEGLDDAGPESRVQTLPLHRIAEEQNPSIYMTAVCLASFINGDRGGPRCN